jgi:hypothetical protein
MKPAGGVTSSFRSNTVRTSAAPGCTEARSPPVGPLPVVAPILAVVDLVLVILESDRPK